MFLFWGDLSGFSDLPTEIQEQIKKIISDNPVPITNQAETAKSRNIVFLILITLLMGVLGGLVNQMTGIDKEEDKATGEVVLLVSITTGIAASLTVPLFLQLIGSNILQKAENDPYQYLIYTGFCLIASIYSRKFLSDLRARITKVEEEALKAKQEADKAEQLAKNLQKQVDDNKQVIDGLNSDKEKRDEDEKKFRDSEKLVNAAKHARSYPKDGLNKIEVIKKSLSLLDEALSTIETARAWGVKGNFLRDLSDQVEEDTNKKSLLNEAIQAETMALNSPFRTPEMEAILYWDRACYRALVGQSIDEVIEDIELSVSLTPSFYKDILGELDFKGHPDYQSLLTKFGED
jgi:hypothetical protein